MLQPTRNNYVLASKAGFMIINNDKILHINYTRGNTTYMNEKTIQKVILLTTYDNSHLIITNNTGEVLLDCIIIERTIMKVLKYALGGMLQQTIIILPFSATYGIAFPLAYLQYCKRRKL